MSVVENHVCDACGKQGTSKSEYGSDMPKNWFNVNASQEGRRGKAFSGEACCPECLGKLLDKAKSFNYKKKE